MDIFNLMLINGAKFDIWVQLYLESSDKIINRWNQTQLDYVGPENLASQTILMEYGHSKIIFWAILHELSNIWFDMSTKTVVILLSNKTLIAGFNGNCVCQRLQR